ncbi:MAG TPA: hypothetical protein PLD23_13655 [Armatimonadota bacterium]|nr:hypothetical protein [Armatimonadota bacterium]HQK94553.1 hypothetical protein [Armatimonadota bacterium]
MRRPRSDRQAAIREPRRTLLTKPQALAPVVTATTSSPVNGPRSQRASGVDVGHIVLRESSAREMRAPGHGDTPQASLIELVHEAISEALASLEIWAVRGYLVKAWQEPQRHSWIAECPTVGCVVEQDSIDAARAAIADSIQDMLEALESEGHPRPPRDLDAANG